jgi:Putative auto-transporter adhesin, head GIN domain
MKQKTYLAMVLMAGLALTGCDWNQQTVIGSGDIESMEVELSPFDGVSVTGSCDVEITLDEDHALKFYAQSEILDVLKYEVINGILHIGLKADFNVNTSKGIRAEIVIPSLSFVAITGEGSFDLEGTQQENLDIHITGAGDVDAFDLEVAACNIRVSGVGNCDVHVSNTLDVNISGVGNVRYMGDPTITTDISGVGNVTAHQP